MGDTPPGPAFEVAFSIQPPPDGFKHAWIGIHWNLPLCQFVVGMSLESAEELARTFPTELTKTIAQAKRQSSGLVIAPESALTTLKGN